MIDPGRLVPMHDEPPLTQAGNGSTDLVAILVHGRGGRAEDMRALAEQLGLGGARCLFPAATGSTWYPQRFTAPLESNEPDLSAALGHYERLVAQLLAEGVPPGRILLGGFSQGACLTAEYLARHPRAYAGASIFTGGLIGPPGTRWPPQPALAGLPVYLASSEIDEWIPMDRVRETEAWLRTSGVDVTTRIFTDRPHTVSAEEIGEARLMIAGLLQPG